MGGGAVLRNLRASGSARLDAGPCRHAAGNASCDDRTPVGAVGHGIFLNSNLETWSPRARLPVPNRRWQASDAAFSVLLAECWPDAPAVWQPARTAISHAQAAGSHTRRSDLSGTPNGTGCDADGGLAPHSVRGRSLVGGRRAFAARWLLLRISPLGRIRAACVTGVVAGSRRAAVYVQRGPRAPSTRHVGGGIRPGLSAAPTHPAQRLPGSADTPSQDARMGSPRHLGRFSRAALKRRSGVRVWQSVGGPQCYDGRGDQAPCAAARSSRGSRMRGVSFHVWLGGICGVSKFEF